MTLDNIRTNGSSPGASPLAFAVSLVAFVIAGCSGYERLAPDTLDKDYTVRGIRWNTGSVTLVFMKAYDHQGKLAVCGAYTATKHTDLTGEGTRQFFNTANMYIGEERIGSLSFTDSVSPTRVRWVDQGDKIRVTNASEQANCVKTGKDWKESYDDDPILFKGPTRITVQM